MKTISNQLYRHAANATNDSDTRKWCGKAVIEEIYRRQGAFMTSSARPDDRCDQYDTISDLDGWRGRPRAT